MYKLSKTSKMPGKSFSIPAKRCKTGSCLAQIKGSVCSKCYARKGSYVYPNVQKVREDNYQHYMNNSDTFVSDMVTIINAEYLKTGVAYFRWFDSGDLINPEMLMDIIDIAFKLPKINFWLPTKEVAMVAYVMEEMSIKGLELPSNLSIRLSAFMIDGNYFNLPSYMLEVRQTRVINKDTTTFDDEIVCPLNCVSCNYACWKSTEKVAYIKH